MAGMPQHGSGAWCRWTSHTFFAIEGVPQVVCPPEGGIAGLLCVACVSQLKGARDATSYEAAFAVVSDSFDLVMPADIIES